jgi:5-methylcytosine-specific restriction endonuclease McrA
MRICSGAGCLRVVSDDVRFCDECKPQTAVEDGIRVHTLADREKYSFLYSGKRWQQLRDLVVRAQPMCGRCHKRLTAIVDHVVPAGVAIVQAQESGKYPFKYAGFYIRSNLQGLCRACHYVKTDEDTVHTGPWPNVVDKDKRTAKKVWSF